MNLVQKDANVTSFEKFAQPGFFSSKLSKSGGKKMKPPRATTWIWNLHADAHDFQCHTDEKGKPVELEEISRKIFSAHFGQLAIIFLWLSGMFFHGARFSNYSAWLECPTLVTPSSHVVWPIVGQGILNGDVGGGFAGIQITSGWFGLWRACGIVNETELYAVAFGGLIASCTMVFAGWFHYHKAAPRLEWFQNAESMLNHHLAGLLGLGCLSWAGHQIHISLPINKLLDAGIAPQDVPLPHEFLFNQELMGQLYPSFKKGLLPFFTFNWGEYSDFLTFKGGLNPITGSLWLSDVAHHHLSLSVIFIFAGHMYRTNWGIGHSIKELLAAHRGPIAPYTPWGCPKGQSQADDLPEAVETFSHNVGLYEILTTSWHAQLAINLAMLGSLSIIVAHHMYAMPPYPYLSIDYSTQVSLFVHHVWIGGFCIVGAGAHASIFMVRDYSPQESFGTLIDASLRHREAIIAHLNWVSIFLGMHSFGLYIHNDTLCALGLEAECFADGAIELQPIFARWIQSVHALAPVSTAPNTLATASYVFGGEMSVIDGRIGIMPIGLGTSDFLVHHIHAFNIHVATLILLKGVLFGRSSLLIPDKAEQGFRFPCDGPGRGGTCQVSAWDHVFLAAFWMYNCISIVIFYFTWKMPSDVWGTVSEGKISHLLPPFQGDYDQTQTYTVNGWFRDYLWAGSLSVIDSYGSELSAYGLIFLGAHFIWAFSLMFLFSGRGYWQELIESILWAHSKLNITPVISPRALSITQGRAVGLAHYLLGGIGVTWAFLLAGFAV